LLCFLVDELPDAPVDDWSCEVALVSDDELPLVCA